MSTAVNDDVLVVRNVSKRYEIYERPADRLKQFILPRLDAALSREPRSYFKEFWALRDVSFAVRKGEAVGILGRNGAGKSTLLQIIAGTLAPTQGEASVRGRVAALLELGSGFSPEFTGNENVRLNAALLGLSLQQIDAAFDQITAFADIGDFIKQPVKIYSSGMMLRLAFAVQTAVEPDLLIVDEALAVGDARFQKKCFGRLDELRRLGTTILFVTHDTGAVIQLCDRAIALENGAIAFDGEPHRVAREYHKLLFGDGSAGSDGSSPARASGPTEPPGTAEVSNTSANGKQSDVPGLNPVGGSVETSATAAAASTEGEPCATPDRPASREVRYGSGEAEIFDVGLLDADGSNTRVLFAGSRCVAYFRAVLRSDKIGPINYGFIISNVKAVEVYGTKSALFNKTIDVSYDGALVECRLSFVTRLVPGRYFLTVALAHADERSWNQFLDYRFDAIDFEVIGSPRTFTTSLVDLEGELEHVALDEQPS